MSPTGAQHRGKHSLELGATPLHAISPDALRRRDLQHQFAAYPVVPAVGAHGWQPFGVPVLHSCSIWGQQWRPVTWLPASLPDASTKFPHSKEI